MASILPLNASSTSILQGYAIISAALAAGTNLSTSIVTIPALLLSPHALLVAQWNVLYNRGIWPSVSLSLTSAASFAVLAYSSYRTPIPASGLTKLYSTAALAALGMAPWTAVMMFETNNRLMELNKERKGMGKGEVEAGEVPVDRLVERWGWLNLVRGFFPLTAAVVGGWASLG